MKAEVEMKSERTFWGVVLVLGGFFFLLNAFNIFDISFKAILAVIFIGLGLTMLYESRSDGYQKVKHKYTGSTMGKRSRSSIPLDDSERARIDIGFAMGKLDIFEGDDPTLLLSGQISNDYHQKISRQGTLTKVNLTPTGSHFMPWTWVSNRTKQEWKLGINPNIPLDLRLETGASKNTLDLTRLNVKDFRLETGASATILHMPKMAGTTNAHIEAGATSLEIYIPQDVAAKIKADSVLAEAKIDTRRFPRVGNWYQSPNYDTAANRVEIRVEIAAGKLTVH